LKYLKSSKKSSHKIVYQQNKHTTDHAKDVNLCVRIHLPPNRQLEKTEENS